MPAEMTLRDHFAAAALTGLLSNVQRYQNEPLTRQAFEIADFMLRERCRAGADCPGQDNAPNLDAAPEARAGTPGTGNTQKPVAWGVVDDRGLQLALHPTPEHASYYARNFGSGLAAAVPLYRHPQPTLTDAEREAIDEAAVWYEGVDDDERCRIVAATLRGLLERMK